jgi:propane monooxygenase small subunit
MAAAQNDYISPSIVSAAEGDYERNLANTVELFSILTQDQTHGEHNRKLLVSWAETNGKLALDAASQLQPIWSQPRVKVVQFNDALDQAKNRFRAIAAEIGFDPRTVLGA